MNWNRRVSGGRPQQTSDRSQITTLRSQFSDDAAPGLRPFRKPALAALLIVLVLGSVALLHSASPAHASKAGNSIAATPNLSSISLPLFFEPNQGQTDPSVKFLARGSGYGLFLTADEAVLEVQGQPSAIGHQRSGAVPKLAAARAKAEAPVTSIVRMHLVGANPAAKIAGSQLLPGKSNYFIGNDPAKWRRDIPQYARVNYNSVYPGVDLVYYGKQGQLEYDFRIAPGGNPRQIALKFEGASPRLENGELVLATRAGDIRFHAPNFYQQEGEKRRTIEGGFRHIANDKIGFEIGAYDHSRELVIDPTLSYSSFIGGGGESDVHVAVDAALNIYVAATTTSASFPFALVDPLSCCTTLNGGQDVFVAKINPLGSGAAQVLFATYLGGSGTETAAGIAVDSGGAIYVAGNTDSNDFPTFNGFQTGPPAVAGNHGFVSKISLVLGQENLSYSTYLSGNLAGTPTAPNPAADQVTGLTVDSSNDAFVTGITNSTDPTGNGFPATPNGFQTSSNGGGTQFFASKINTALSGPNSMVYSTFFGGGFPAQPTIFGGGIAIDTSGNMYFTGGSNFLGVTGPGGETPFPVLDAQQVCLNQAGKNDKSQCGAPSSPTDAFIAKINPTIVGAGSLAYSTLLGGSGDDIGLAIAVDSSSNAYITGSTSSTDWNQPPGITAFQNAIGGGPDAFIAKLGALNSGVFPIAYFTYLGGANEDIGRAIAVDSVQAAHVAGITNSSNLDVLDPLSSSSCHGAPGDAFVALISTTTSGRPTNSDYLTCLGGTAADDATGIAIDSNNATYVAGDTRSGDFPTVNSLQSFTGTQDAFISRISAVSSFAFDTSNNIVPLTVSPTPADVGSQVTITFKFINNGPEAAANVVFSGTLSSNIGVGQGFTFTSATASPGGSCPNPTNGVVTCNVGTVAAGSDVTITVVMVPTVQTPAITSLNVTPTLSANGSAFVGFACPLNPCPLPVAVDDFAFTPPPSPTTQTVTAGGSASYTTSLSVTGSGSPLTYTNSISMSASISPANSTITTTFTPSSVTISGSGPTTSTLNVATQPRPVNGGSLWHRGPIYATWLPIGGLSLLGLGVGASRRRRRWIAGALLGMIAGIVLLQGACGNSSSNAAQTGGTPAGTYTIRITGTSGSDSHLTEVQLIVN